MRANCLLLTLATALAILGIAKGDADVYPAPYDCVYYYTCVSSQPCAPNFGVCSGNNYNHTEVTGEELGMCLYESGNGCIYFNGNATCDITVYYNDPPGAACGQFNVVCSIPNNIGSGCEYGEAPR